MDNEEEVPKYFTCPISLQIMKDPVTAVTGITYDRETIEKWLSTKNDNNNPINDDKTTTCPVTNQLLPRNSDLTPNHNLRRLIQAWCVTNGHDRIPTPKPPLDRRHVANLLRAINTSDDPTSPLKKLADLAAVSDRNRKLLAKENVTSSMTSFILRSFRKDSVPGPEPALKILRHVGTADVAFPEEFIDALTWILGVDEPAAKAEAIKTLKLIITNSETRQLERLRLELFMKIVNSLRCDTSALKPGLETLAEVCPYGRNKAKIIESDGVSLAVEVLISSEDRHVTELAMTVLSQLSTCAEGRERLVGHGAGIAVVSKRILRVSREVDEVAVRVLGHVARFSAKREVVEEMMAVGAVAKLCMVMQADCDNKLKETARGILRLHSKLWNQSPCIALYLMSRHRS